MDNLLVPNLSCLILKRILEIPKHFYFQFGRVIGCKKYEEVVG